MTSAETIQVTQYPFTGGGHMSAQSRLALNRMAKCDCPVLLSGEPGVGKGFTASLIHMQSHRAREAYKEIDCLDLDAEGVVAALATRGTVYLVEVADLDLALQELIVHDYFLTEQTETCRLLFGTSRELSEEVRSGRMREDFYYCISRITLRIPPLRHRRSEILVFADTLLTQYAKQFDRPRPPLTGEISEFLTHHTWPENLNELQTAIKTLVVIGDESISLAALKAATPSVRRNGNAKNLSLKEAARRVSIQVERQLISEVLGSTRGNRKRAADELGISYKALLYKIKQFGVETAPVSKEAGVSL